MSRRQQKNAIPDNDLEKLLIIAMWDMKALVPDEKEQAILRQRELVKAYYHSEIVPMLFEYEFLK